MVVVVHEAGRSTRARVPRGEVVRPRWRRPRSGFRDSLPISLGLFGFLFAASAIDMLEGGRGGYVWSLSAFEGVGWSVRMLLSDPGWSVPFVLGAPWLALVATPLVLILGVTAGLRSALRGARGADRALGAGLAVAGVLVVVPLFLEVPPRAAPSILVARIVVVLAGVALAPSLLFQPFREASGAAEGRTHLPSLFVWSALVFQLDLVRTIPCWSLGTLLPGLGLESSGLFEGIRTRFAGEVWLRLGFALPLLLVPAIVVCHGRTLTGAVADLARAWRCRPGATLRAHLTVAGAATACGSAWVVAVGSGFHGAGVILGVLLAGLAGIALSGTLHFAALAAGRIAEPPGSVESSDSEVAPLHSGPCSTSAGGTFSS